MLLRRNVVCMNALAVRSLKITGLLRTFDFPSFQPVYLSSNVSKYNTTFSFSNAVFEERAIIFSWRQGVTAIGSLCIYSDDVHLLRYAYHVNRSKSYPAHMPCTTGTYTPTCRTNSSRVVDVVAFLPFPCCGILI